MSIFFEELMQGIYATSYWEWQAMIGGVLYVIFAIKEKLICWLFAFISSITYIYVCTNAKLYLDAFLQAFYVIMAVVGFVNWNRAEKETHIHIWKVNRHSFNIFFTMIISLGLGYIFEKYTDQANPYLDALTTCFSLSATYMVARKVLGNWIYWIVIDSILAYLYFSRGLKLSSLLMIFYTIMAVKGFIEWHKIYKTQLKQTV